MGIRILRSATERAEKRSKTKRVKTPSHTRPRAPLPAVLRAPVSLLPVLRTTPLLDALHPHSEGPRVPGRVWGSVGSRVSPPSADWPTLDVILPLPVRKQTSAGSLES